jgi:hypothetical protein
MKSRYAGIEVLHTCVDAMMSLEAMERGVKTIFQYYDAQPDDRRKLLSILTVQFAKCTIEKIQKRLAVFEQIRGAALNLSDHPADDIGILISVTFHGMDTTSMSLATGHAPGRNYTSGSKYHLPGIPIPG